MLHHGDDVVVGQSAAENSSILASARPYDVWLHLQSFPSAHVILKCADHGSAPTAARLAFAGNLCREHGKYRRLRNLKVIYTRVSNVVPTNKPGQVEFKSARQCKTMTLGTR